MMEQNLVDSILAVCSTLNKHSVQYMIVGGAAVAFHGYYRASLAIDGTVSDKPDLDVWYNPTYDNYFKLLNALEDLGKDVKKYKEEQAPDPKRSFFKYEFYSFTLDFLPELKAPFNFRLSYEKREIVALNGIDISFIGYDDLIKDKEATSRAKDLEDIKHLKNNRNEDI